MKNNFLVCSVIFSKVEKIIMTCLCVRVCARTCTLCVGGGGGRGCHASVRLFSTQGEVKKKVSLRVFFRKSTVCRVHALCLDFVLVGNRPGRVSIRLRLVVIHPSHFVQ